MTEWCVIVNSSCWGPPLVTMGSAGVSAKSSDLIGLWNEDLAPLRHSTAESVRE